MGEAILVKAGGLGSGSDPEDQNIISWELKTELITNSQQFIVPKAKDQQFSVRIFGGGGGWWNSMFNGFPSGAGNMNFAHLKLNKLDIIPVTIGVAGRENEVGATTSFGDYLAATGGGLPDIPNHIGAPGGIGGEAYILLTNHDSWSSQWGWTNYQTANWTSAGISTYGGGSGGLYYRFNNMYYYYLNQDRNSSNIIDERIYAHGANGGIYGGGGATTHDQSPRTGGKGCGNGANIVLPATNGKNTIGSLEEFTGWGTVNNWTQYNGTKGGGGYGGNGGWTAGALAAGYIGGANICDIDWAENNLTCYICSGGGGYGANGEGGRGGLNGYAPTGVYRGGRGGGYGGMYGYGLSNYGSGMSGKVYVNNRNNAILESVRYPSNGIAIISYYSPVYKT